MFSLSLVVDTIVIGAVHLCSRYIKQPRLGFVVPFLIYGAL